MKKKVKILIIIFALAIVVLTIYLFVIKGVSISITSNGNLPKISLQSDSKTISLKQIDNVGYSFYLGQIDYPDTPDIDDNTKNKITQIIYKAKFPKSLLKNMAIIIVNTLAISPDQYIKVPNGKIKVPDFSPDFMTGGGIYSHNVGQMSLIFINKSKLGNIDNILTHELGHHISSQLTNEEWKKYYQLRGIPSNTPRYSQNWMLSPIEDFAEVYKNIFTGLPIRTAYGLLVNNKYLYFENTCGKIYDKLIDNYIKTKYLDTDPWDTPLFVTEEEANITSNAELQNCRREVLSHPEKYPADWEIIELFGAPYNSVVDQATEDFIINIVNKLNQK